MPMHGRPRHSKVPKCIVDLSVVDVPVFYLLMARVCFGIELELLHLSSPITDLHMGIPLMLGALVGLEEHPVDSSG